MLRRNSKVLTQTIQERFRNLGGAAPFGVDAELSLCWRGNVFALNSMGAAIWQLVETGCNVDDIISHITSECFIPLGRARDDVHRFLSEMMEFGLIEEYEHKS